MLKTLAPGFFIRVSSSDETAGHTIGGVLEGGEQCPNCALPLMVHLMLDASDERLNLSDCGPKRLPLAYCMRCALCWSDFVYKLEEGSGITILEAETGERMDEWYELVGVDVFPERKISLQPVPGDIQDVFDKCNAGLNLSDAETMLVARAAQSFAREEVGGYPIVDVTNQVCGRAFLQQRLQSPTCVSCAEPMYFLAALCNDERQAIRFSYDDAQIVFFLCKACKVVTVQSSA